MRMLKSNYISVLHIYWNDKIIFWSFFTFSSYNKVLVLCKKSFSEFSSNLNVLCQKETVFTKLSVHLSVVCSASVNMITLDRIIGLHWALVYFIGGQEVKTSSLAIKNPTLVSDSAHVSLLIILETFFD